MISRRTVVKAITVAPFLRFGRAYGASCPGQPPAWREIHIVTSESGFTRLRLATMLAFEAACSRLPVQLIMLEYRQPVFRWLPSYTRRHWGGALESGKLDVRWLGESAEPEEVATAIRSGRTAGAKRLVVVEGAFPHSYKGDEGEALAGMTRTIASACAPGDRLLLLPEVEVMRQAFARAWWREGEGSDLAWIRDVADAAWWWGFERPSWDLLGIRPADGGRTLERYGSDLDICLEARDMARVLGIVPGRAITLTTFHMGEEDGRITVKE